MRRAESLVRHRRLGSVEGKGDGDGGVVGARLVADLVRIIGDRRHDDPGRVARPHGRRHVQQASTGEEMIDQLTPAPVHTAVRLIGWEQRRQVPQSLPVASVGSLEPGGADLGAGWALQDLVVAAAGSSLQSPANTNTSSGLAVSRRSVR